MTWSYTACWKTIGAVTEGLKKLMYNKDKLVVLKDNIQIRYLGLGWDKCKTQWSKVGVKLSIADLTNRLENLMRLGKKSELFQQSLMLWSHSGEICLLLVNGLSRFWN